MRSHLAATINALLARLDATSALERQFTARAARELDGPVRSIRNQLEQEPHPSIANAWQDVAAGGVLQHISRTEQIIEELLLLARLELTPRRSADITDLGMFGEGPR